MPVTDMSPEANEPGHGVVSALGLVLLIIGSVCTHPLPASSCDTMFETCSGSAQLALHSLSEGLDFALPAHLDIKIPYGILKRHS